jgi:hypothetical protein
MGLVLIEGSDTFGINHDDIDLLAVGGDSLDGSAPAPQSLSTGVDGGSHSEPVASVEQDAVEEVGLAGAVEAGHGDDSDGSLDGSEKLDGFFSDYIFCISKELLPVFSLTATIEMAFSAKGLAM